MVGRHKLPSCRPGRAWVRPSVPRPLSERVNDFDTPGGGIGNGVVMDPGALPAQPRAGAGPWRPRRRASPDTPSGIPRATIARARAAASGSGGRPAGRNRLLLPAPRWPRARASGGTRLAPLRVPGRDTARARQRRGGCGGRCRPVLAARRGGCGPPPATRGEARPGRGRRLAHTGLPAAFPAPLRAALPLWPVARPSRDRLL